MLIIKFLFCIICIEATTELLSKSEFFRPLRKYLFEKRTVICTFLHSIFDCPYCLSVWVSLFYIMYFYAIYKFQFTLLLFLPIVLFLHRASNILHYIIDRLRGPTE